MHSGPARGCGLSSFIIDVLVVDDHPMARDWTARHLAQCEGIRVMATASDGAEAYKILAEKTPTCVILDLRLPDCSGVDIARHLRQTKPSVAVVVLTGYPDPASRSALARLGVRQFLSKTASGADIENAVREAIGHGPTLENPLCSSASSASSASATLAGRANPERLRVLIVDDHPLTGHGTGVALELAGHEVVGIATTGNVALELARREEPQLVILDLQLPDMSGVSVARQLLRSRPRPYVVVLTAQRDETYARALFRIGIHGYLTKEASTRDLLATIDVVVRGGTVNNNAPLDEDLGGLPVLSERERDILILVARGRKNTEIAHTLNVSSKTVEYHLTGLFQRFDVRNRTELTHVAFAFGLA